MHPSITHTTLSGHTVHVGNPAEEVVQFLARMQAMVDDPKVTEDELIGFAYSRANPILDHTLFPERGAVTREVFDRPEYAIVTDLLARKRVAAEGLDVERLAADYTLTVAEAAERLGVHESAIRQAIAARRLPSWMKGGRHYLAPRSVDAYEVGTRGPKSPTRPRPAAPLDVTIGHLAGLAFKVKHAGRLEDEQRVEGNILSGRLTGWRRAAVLVDGDRGARLYVIEPGEDEERIEAGPFYVRGRFRVVEKVNNARRAREAWKAFEAA